MQTSTQSRRQDKPRIYCWLQSKEEKGLLYTFQVESTKKSDLNKIKKLLKAEISGEGYNPTTGTLILILKKSFANAEAFRLFQREIDLNIERIKN